MERKSMYARNVVKSKPVPKQQRITYKQNMKRWRGESDLARFAGTGGRARPMHAKMVLVASGRKEGSAVISTRELGCKSLHVCRKCREGARDIEEIKEHNRTVHK